MNRLKVFHRAKRRGQRVAHVSDFPWKRTVCGLPLAATDPGENVAFLDRLADELGGCSRCQRFADEAFGNALADAVLDRMAAGPRNVGHVVFQDVTADPADGTKILASMSTTDPGFEAFARAQLGRAFPIILDVGGIRIPSPAGLTPGRRV